MRLNGLGTEHHALYKACRRLYAAVKENGRYHSLGGIGEYGRALAPSVFLLAVTHAQIRSQLKLLRDAVEAVLAHKLGTKSCHFALRQRGHRVIQVLCSYKAEHRIAQKLQALVAGNSLGAVFVCIRAVRQGVF